MKSKKPLILISVVIVVIIAVVTIISPKFFQKNKTTPVQVSTNPTTIGCPVIDTLCTSSKVLETPQTAQPNTSVLGYKIPKYSQVFAVFDGTMKEEITPISSSSAIYIVTLTSSSGKYQAHYFFLSFRLNANTKTTTLPEKKVKIKDVIAPIIEDNLGGFFKDQNVNLTFNVSFTNGGPIILNPQSVGRIVLP